MFNSTFKVIFFLAWFIYFFGLYTPALRSAKKNKVVDDRSRGWELPLSLLAFAGIHVVPLIYILSPVLDFANYPLPDAVGWVGTVVFAFSLWITFRAHVDLGNNWTPTVQICEEHTLVTSGIYHTLRHPIYAAQILWGIAQLLVLHNWIVGPLALITFLPIFLYRIPREEQMMLDNFGDGYRDYMKQTGGIIPHFR